MSSPAVGALVALARTPAAAARCDLTARGAVVCSVLAMALITALDLIDGQLGLVFAVGFVLVVLSAAVAVDLSGLFIVGVLPPFLLVATILAVAVIAPEAIVIAGLPAGTGVFGLTLAAAIDNAIALLLGHALAVAAIVTRLLGSKPN